METASEMLETIMQACHAHEGHSIHQFRLYRARKSGETQALDVEVRVSQLGAERTRYSVSFETEGGKRASGNGHETLQGACYILSTSPILD